MAQLLRVNPIRCEAHGYCAELLPELVALDDWGYPIVADEPVPRDLLDHARRAADACPKLALRLARGEAPAPRAPRPTGTTYRSPTGPRR